MVMEFQLGLWKVMKGLLQYEFLFITSGWWCSSESNPCPSEVVWEKRVYWGVGSTHREVQGEHIFHLLSYVIQQTKIQKLWIKWFLSQDFLYQCQQSIQCYSFCIVKALTVLKGSVKSAMACYRTSSSMSKVSLMFLGKNKKVSWFWTLFCGCSISNYIADVWKLLSFIALFVFHLMHLDCIVL